MNEFAYCLDCDINTEECTCVQSSGSYQKVKVMNMEEKWQEEVERRINQMKCSICNGNNYRVCICAKELWMRKQQRDTTKRSKTNE